MNGTLAERFWAKVDKSAGEEGCWVWTGYCDEYGDGFIDVSVRDGRGREGVNVRRLSYELCIGPIRDGMFVRHRCDTRACCNPAHLFLAWSSSASKLADEQAQRIREVYAAGGVSQSALARQYGVSRQAVFLICHRKSHRHGSKEADMVSNMAKAAAND